MASKRVALVGGGNMGSALGRALVEAGTAVTVWNRTQDRPGVKALVDAGAVFEADVGAALGSDGVVIICLVDYDAVYAVLRRPAASSLAGKTIVNLTTGTPKEARDAETWFKGQGASHYYEGSVMGLPSMVGTPSLAILYSGEDKDSFTGSGVSELLEPLGRPVYEGPEVGAAASADLAALSAMYGMIAGGFVGMALLRRQGAAAAAAAAAAEHGKRPRTSATVGASTVPLVSSMAPYLSQLAEAVDDERWDDSLGGPVGMQLTAVKTILRACREEGVDAGVLEGLAANMQRGVDERGGDGGIAIAAMYLARD